MMMRVVNRILKVVGFEMYRIPSDMRGPVEETDLAMYRRLYPRESVEGRRFYNIGGGSFRHPAWTNVEHASEWYKNNRIDLDWDLMSLSRIPVEDNSAELVYTSHTIEHVTNAAAAHLFAEARRILKPGGILRVTAPNIDLYYRAYRENDRLFFFWENDPLFTEPDHYRGIGLARPLREVSMAQLFLSEFASAASTAHSAKAEKISDDVLEKVFKNKPYAEALDYCVARCPPESQTLCPGNHINWWNPEKAISMLKTAGFQRVYPSAYGQSRAPVLRNIVLFDCTYPQISFYVEAQK